MNVIQCLGKKPGVSIVKVNDYAGNLRNIKLTEQFQSLVTGKNFISISKAPDHKILHKAELLDTGSEPFQHGLIGLIHIPGSFF
jgi:hypothetical protein